jgi:hypothetical protein
MAAKLFASPAVPNVYPANSAAKPSVQQPFVRTPVPVKPYPLAAAVARVTQPRGGFMNPSQQHIPPAQGASALPSKSFRQSSKQKSVDMHKRQGNIIQQEMRILIPFRTKMSSLHHRKEKV